VYQTLRAYLESQLKLVSFTLLAAVLLSSIYIYNQQASAKQNLTSRTKIIQDLKKKVATLLAPCDHVGNSTNPSNLLQCQAALSELETFEETVSAEIAGLKGVIGQILRNIH
jgi:hypothetical protein